MTWFSCHANAHFILDLCFLVPNSLTLEVTHAINLFTTHVNKENYELHMQNRHTRSFFIQSGESHVRDSDFSGGICTCGLPGQSLQDRSVWITSQILFARQAGISFHFLLQRTGPSVRCRFQKPIRYVCLTSESRHGFCIPSTLSTHQKDGKWTSIE